VELLYHVNESDQVIGSVERARAHADGLLHRSGMVFLWRSDGRVLLQDRSPEKDTFPACYDSSCAFHVTFGESYDEAARRELLEETGITATLEYLGKFVHHSSPEHEVVVVYECRSDEQIRILETEATSASFYTREEVDRIIATGKVTPWLRDGWLLARGRTS
jgi:isopentenyl-diphosphate delta-isomerase type 1